MKKAFIHIFLLFLTAAAVGGITIGVKNAIDMNGNTLTGLPTPTADAEAANKAYCDANCGGAAGGGPFLPGTSAAASEASHIHLVNLNDTRQMEDLAGFRAVEAISAHVTGLGILPKDFVIISRDDTLVLHDIRTNTDYAKFQGGTNNAIPAACDLRGLDFIDGFVFAACHSSGGGVIRIDFATGEIKRWTESGPQYYGNGVRGGIANRNGGEGYREIAPGSGREWDLLDDEAYDVAVNRYLMPHPFDDAGRRKHFISVGAVAGVTILSPEDHNAKDGAVATDGEVVSVTERGQLFAAGDNGVEVDIRLYRSTYGLSSATTVSADETFDNDQTESKDLFITDAATFGGFDIGETGQFPTMALGTSEAAIITHIISGGFLAESQKHMHTLIKGAKNFPTFVGSEVNIYAFEAASPEDGGPDGNDLSTSVGSPTYSAGIVGNALHLDGSSNVELAASNFDLDGGWVVALWCSTAATASNQTIIHLDNTADMALQVIATTGVLQVTLDDGTAGDDNISYGGDAGETPIWGTSASPDPGWHHIAVIKEEEANGFFRLYVDGTQVDSTAVTNAATEFFIAELYAGDNAGNTEGLTGAIDELVIAVNVEYVEQELIRHLYYRGLSGKNLSVDPTDGLDATAVVEAAAYKNTVAFASADSVTLLNHYGIPYNRLGTVSGTVNAVDLSSNFDGLPVVAIGATTSFSVTVSPTDTNATQGLNTLQPRSIVTDDVIANPCVLDSAGIRGLFWDVGAQGGSPFIACSRAGIHYLKVMPGIYRDAVNISPDSMMIEGSGYRHTKFRNWTQSVNTHHFTISGDWNYITDILIADAGNNSGASGTSDAVEITGDGNLLRNIYIHDADLEGITINSGKWNTLYNIRCDADVDRSCVSVEGNSQYTSIINIRVPLFSGSNPGTGVNVFSDSVSIIGGFIGGEPSGTQGSVVINAGADQCIVAGVLMAQDFTDNGTGTSTSANKSNP